MLTSERSLGAGPAIRTGTQAAYRGVVELPGEPQVARAELFDGDANREGEPIVRFVHITDLHVTDTESPARFEFVNAYWQDPRFRELLTMQRPQETLNMHAVAAMVRAINRLDDVQLVAVTGDLIDNTKRNELDNALALLDGGHVRPDSGAGGYDGVQRIDWPGDIYWKPDGPPDGDIFQSELGFPPHPGLLEQAMAPFHSEGLRFPWIGCYGNHEQVCQGVGVVTPEVARAMSRSRKSVGPPTKLDPEGAVAQFTDHPEAFMTGPAVDVPPDPDRRPISREEFVDALVSAGGHGFTDASFYACDVGDVRFMTLDTVCDAGGADGSIGGEQLHWLERRLEEVHSSFRARDGGLVRTRNRDRYVVILSHHGSATLSNPRCEPNADELIQLLHRFGNVVLWMNGHIHMNRITAHGSLWEVATGALVDWPCQGRVVEIYRTGAGGLAIGCTMLDHDGAGLAGLHRELAANVPYRGFDSVSAGDSDDRNVVLLLPAPF